MRHCYAATLPRNDMGVYPTKRNRRRSHTLVQPALDAHVQHAPKPRSGEANVLHVSTEPHELRYRVQGRPGLLQQLDYVITPAARRVVERLRAVFSGASPCPPRLPEGAPLWPAPLLQALRRPAPRRPGEDTQPGGRPRHPENSTTNMHCAKYKAQSTARRTCICKPLMVWGRGGRQADRQSRRHGSRWRRMEEGTRNKSCQEQRRATE